MSQHNSEVDSDVRLVHIEVDGYRSCRSTKFVPHPELTALIGINGAGKTNLLHAIRLLSVRPARGRYGASDDLQLANETKIVAWFSFRGIRIGLKLDIRLTESSRNTDELVSISETWNFHQITNSKAWKKMPPLALLKDGIERLRFEQQALLFESKVMLEKSSRLIRVHEPVSYDFELADNSAVVEAFKAVSDFRIGIAYYSASQFTDPTRCPSSFEVDENSRLQENAYGISRPHLKFIFDLYTLKASNPNKYSDFAKFVARDQLGLISRITWKEIVLSSNTAEIKSGGVLKKIKKTKTLVIPKIQIGASYITFNQLSEGTFKTLALIFYIMTDSSKFLLVEEPEVCVHHGLLARITATIKAYSKTKQVIFSTHSDSLVDELGVENICVIEMQKDGTKSTALEQWVGKDGKAALHAYLEESGTLGEYWRSGGLS